MDHLHDRLWQGAKKDPQNAHFKGEKKMRDEAVECDEGQESGGEGPDDAKDE